MFAARRDVFKASQLVRDGLPGSLMDLHADDGSGACALALRIAARHQAGTGKTIIIIDSTGDFYPPAAVKEGVALERLLVVRARREAAVLAALDEALRCKAVAAALARVRRLDGAGSHRLRVAAEKGGGLGLLVRPLDDRTAVSAAAVRVIVRGGGRVEPFRVRGGGRCLS